MLAAWSRWKLPLENIEVIAEDPQIRIYALPR